MYDTNRINSLVEKALSRNHVLLKYYADALNHRSGKVIYRDIWLSFNLARNAQKLSEKCNYRKGLADAILNQAMAASVEGDYERSENFCDSALSIYAIQKDTVGMIHSFFWRSISFCFSGLNKALADVDSILKFGPLGKDTEIYGDVTSLQSFISFLKGENEKSLEYMKTSISVFLKMNNKPKLAQCYHKLSLIYSRKGKYEIAMNYALKALRIFADAGENVYVVKMLNKIANLLIDNDDLCNVRRVFNVEYPLLEKINIKRSWGTYYSYMYQYYLLKKDYKKAIKYLHYNYNIQKTINDTLNLSLALSNIALVYVETDSLDEALDAYQKVLNIQEKIGYKYGEAVTLAKIGAIYNKQKKYQQAVESLERSNIYFGNDVDNKQMIENYNELSKAYINLKDYVKAYECLELYTTQWDSLYQGTVQKQISDLRLKYESEEKDYKIKKLSDAQEISELKSKREQLYTSILIIVLILMTALFILIYITFKQRQKNKYQSMANETQRKVAKAILEAQDKERNAIGRDLHDSIGAMVATAKLNLSSSLNEDAEKIKTKISASVKDLDQVVKELRVVARNLMTDIISESGIKSAIQHYIEKINHAQLDINFKFISVGDFSKMNNNAQITLYKIFLELTNNCIKYSKASEATIELAELDKQLIFTMEDNGVGFDVEKCLNKGLGLQNINYRVTLLGGKCQIDSSSGKGTSISIELNM